MTDPDHPDLPGLLLDWERARIREWDEAPASSFTVEDFRALRQILQNVLTRTGPAVDEAYRMGREWPLRRGREPEWLRRAGLQWPWQSKRPRRSNSEETG